MDHVWKPSYRIIEANDGFLRHEAKVREKDGAVHWSVLMPYVKSFRDSVAPPKVQTKFDPIIAKTSMEEFVT